jgi:hypothetical protein
MNNQPIILFFLLSSTKLVYELKIKQNTKNLPEPLKKSILLLYTKYNYPQNTAVMF